MMLRFRLCAAAIGLTGVTTAFGAVVENDNLRVEFFESDLGKGRVAHIVSTANGTDFASGNAQPLWRIECRQTNDFTKVKSADASRAKAYAWRKIADGVEFTYRDIEGVLAEVVCRVTAKPGDDKIRWRITSRPAPGWATYDTAFPIIPLSEGLGGDPTDDCVTMGTAKGGVNRYPMNPKREYWKSRHHGAFPGQLVCPFGAFYDPKLGGLYTAAEDNQGWAKDLLMDRWWREKQPDGTFREGDFILRWNHLEYSETERETQYDIVTRAFQGTDGEPCQWRDAADVYREWSKNQRWSQTKLIDRASVPPWAKNGPFEMKFNRAWFRHPGLANRWFREYKDKRFPNVPFVIECEGWEKNGDWVTPDYFPCYPTDAAFSAFCAEARKSDGHVWAWPGGHHWNVRVGKRPDGAYNLDYTEKFEREVRQHCCANPDGSPRLDPLNWLGGGVSATLCPATEYGRAWWTKYVCCGLVARGVDLVQADQDVGARLPTCWSRRHGHKPGPGRWAMAAQRHQFETMLTEMRRINPEAMFSFEEMHEYFNDLYAFCDYRNCRYRGPEWASVWNYLYHEYVPPFQSGYEQHTKWHWMAFAAADGQMPRLPMNPATYPGWSSASKPDEAKANGEMRAFCERWALLYRGAGRPYLAHGRELHPPKIECEHVVDVDVFRGDKIDVVRPTVYGSAWEAADGSRALMFVNATPYPQAFAYRWSGRWTRLTLAPHELRLTTNH